MTDNDIVVLEGKKEDLLFQRIDVHNWPDNSRIEMVRYRTDPDAPWINGMHEIHCGECGDQIGEMQDRQDARIFFLEHALAHMHDEIRAYRKAFLKLGQGLG